MTFNAKVYADTRNISREKWLELRRNGIGGSEASAIMGLNPYSSPLHVYMDKIGKGKEEEPNEAMIQGTDLEGYVAERFTRDTGMKVRKVNRILQHPEYPWMLANIDREVVGLNAGLECKTTSPFSKFKFDDGEINPHYYWQSMHYMAVTGAERWFVAVLVLGKAFHVFEIKRDESAIQRLFEAEMAFWENNVIPKVPPLPTGNEADDEAIAAIYPVGNDDEEEAADVSDLENILNLRDLTMKRRDELDAEIKEYDQQIKLAMGTNQRGFSTTWKVNWTNTSTSRVDAKLLKEKYPDIAREVTKYTTGRRFSVARVKND